MRAAVQKFTIDTHFAADGTILHEPQGPKISFSIEEVEAERAAAYAAGRADETAQAKQRIARALEAIATSAQALRGAYGQETALLRQEAADLALAVGQAVAGAALDAFGAARAREVIGEALDALRGAPRVLIRLSEQDAERLNADLDALARDHGLSEAICVRADPAMARGDVSLDWPQGAITLDRAAAVARAQAILARTLAAADGQPPPTDTPPTTTGDPT